jgi:hypothetical protein
MPLPKRDLRDWEWVGKQIADDAPVPYDANDPDDGSYNPNDDEASVRRQRADFSYLCARGVELLRLSEEAFSGNRGKNGDEYG